MTTLARRLLEICDDLGLPEKRGRSKALGEIVGLSSGRMTQILKDGLDDPTIKLSEKAVRSLADLGYSALWIQEGMGEKMTPRLAGSPPPAPGRGLDPSSADDALQRIEQALTELLIIDEAREEVLALIKTKAHQAASLVRVIREIDSGKYKGPERRQGITAGQMLSMEQSGHSSNKKTG